MIMPDQYRFVASVVARLLMSVVLFGAGWTAQGWRKDAEIAGMTATASDARATSAEQAAADLQSGAVAMRAAADEVRRSSATLKASMAAITKELKNAPALPADCKPDAVRVRGLRDAYDAARRSATGQ